MKTEHPLEIQVPRGTKVNVVEVDKLEGDFAAAVVTNAQNRLRVRVKRLNEEIGVSSRVVDITMCG